MESKARNIYKRARRERGLTQEFAAECLEISPDSLRAYENDMRIPPNDVVDRMIDLYEAEWLAPMHLRASTQLAEDIIPSIRPGLPFGQAVCRLYRLLNDFVVIKDHDMELMRIAEDGVVADSELEPYNRIMDELLVGIVQAALEVRYSDKTGYPDGE